MWLVANLITDSLSFFNFLKNAASVMLSLDLGGSVFENGLDELDRMFPFSAEFMIDCMDEVVASAGTALDSNDLFVWLFVSCLVSSDTDVGVNENNGLVSLLVSPIFEKLIVGLTDKFAVIDPAPKPPNPANRLGFWNNKS